MKKLQKGFTLIELLVVIAIIGILSSVVLASLNSARNRGANAAIKANLGNIRAQGEIVQDDRLQAGQAGYSNVNLSASFCPGTGTFFAGASIVKFINAARQAAGGSMASLRCASDASSGVATSYVVQATLRSPEVINGITYVFWCADASGNSRPTNTPLTGTPTSCGI